MLGMVRYSSLTQGSFSPCMLIFVGVILFGMVVEGAPSSPPDFLMEDPESSLANGEKKLSDRDEPVGGSSNGGMNKSGIRLLLTAACCMVAHDPDKRMKRR